MTNKSATAYGTIRNHLWKKRNELWKRRNQLWNAQSVMERKRNDLWKMAQPLMEENLFCV